MQPGLVLTLSTAKFRSKDTPVGIFPRGWDHSVNPAGYITVDQARALRKSGDWYSCNSGKDVAEAGPSTAPVAEDKQKSRWVPVTYRHMGEKIGFTVNELLA